MDINDLKKKLLKSQFDTRQRVMLYQEILIGIEDNVSIPEIIKDIHAVYVRKKSPFKVMTKEWLVGSASGKRFSEYTKGWIPDNELFLISAGEEKDKLNESFSELIRIVSEQEELIKSIKSKIYPQIFLFFALSGAIYAFSSKLAPGFKKIMPEDQWPTSAQHYFAFSDWYVANGHYLIFAMIAFLIISFLSFKTLTGEIRNKLDKYPPWSAYREIQSAQFLVVVSGMVKSGIAMKDILSNLNKNSSPYLKSHLKKMIFKLARGVGDGESLNTGLLNEDIVDKVTNYSKRSGFHKGIMALGRRSSREMIEKIEKGANKAGSYINYAIYLYVGFTIVALSEMVSTMISGNV